MLFATSGRLPTDPRSAATQYLMTTVATPDVDKAEDNLALALAMAPSTTLIVTAMAEFQYKVKKDGVRARELFLKAVALDFKRSVKTLNNLAVLLYNDFQDIQGAEKYLRMAVDIDPKHEQSLENLIQFLSKVAKNKRDAKSFSKKLAAIKSARANPKQIGPS